MNLKKQPLFSVIIPAFNVDHILENTLESIYSQTFTEFEVIVINDESSDDTEKILLEFSRKHSNFIYQTVSNGGPGKARNKGIELATGKYLLFFDADDAIPKHTLMTYYNLMKTEDVDLIVSGYELNVVSNNQVLSSRKVSHRKQLYLTKKSFISDLYTLMEQQLMYVVWNKVYKRDIIVENEIKFPNFKSSEDRLFNLSYFHHVNKVLVTEEILYYYSFDGVNSLTNRFIENKFDTFVHFYNSVLDLTGNIDIEGYSALFLKGVLSSIVPIYSKDCRFSYSEKKEYIKKVITHRSVVEANNVAKTDTLMRKISKVLFKIQSVHLMLVATSIIYIISVKFPRALEDLKRLF
ncbi:glycosyltransferase family 2 protein [Atopobacter phocae]|uniref:glycosyltransferase family 2 protein n=1 Tax=Atopobacter phocae TaxID=136492 RepID=UPI00046FA7F8|nr:glycosyltransferase family A protein [Atopobacter phocae]